MKNEIRQILDKQAVWQKSRIRKSWKQKLREAAAMRDTLKALKKGH